MTDHGGDDCQTEGQEGRMSRLGRFQNLLEAIAACDWHDAEMAAPVLHADDTPIRVLDRSRRDRGLGKGVKQGRVWAYVSDQRPWAGTAPPGVVYRFSPDRKGEHPQRHLHGSGGILQADAYHTFADLRLASRPEEEGALVTGSRRGFPAG